ncbi:MAG TPA: glycosyltransferase family 4 protein [Methanoregulaceae archaeon]|nr:glycosyltransferase family 4 protein [Methanoregulaceae archaeon]HQJ87341.1 glycosyltransferase family 4 protein [Methanoregulaceae archaeon]
MKLLICASEYYPHGFGIANVAHHVVERLRVRGVSCTVCSPTGPEIRVGSGRLVRQFAIGGLLHYWHGVSRLCRTGTFDAVWLHNPLFPGSSPFPHAVATIHSTYRNKFRFGMSPAPYFRMASWIEQRSLSRLAGRTRFTAVSGSVAADLAEIGIEPTGIELVPNGVDTSVFSPAEDRASLRREWGIPVDRTILLSLGRVSEAKQPVRLVEVFARVHETVPEALLVIAGGGDQLDQTRARVEALGLSGHVRFLGPVDYRQVPDLYRLADCYIMASRSEGSPLSLLEALSSGLPAVVSAIPPLQFVGDEGLGRVVEFSEPESAATQIADHLRTDLVSQGNRARRFVAEYHDWSVIADRYLALFEELPA